MGNKTQRRLRILEGAFSMSTDSGVTEQERLHWSDKAEELAEQYGLSEALEAWKSGASTKPAMKSWVHTESIYVAESDSGWADSAMSALADVFDCRVIRRKVNEEKDFDTLGDEMNLFVAYDFVADRVRAAAAEAASLALSSTIYELVQEGQMSEQNILFFVNQFCNNLSDYGSFSGKEIAVLKNSAEVEDYVSTNYGTTTKAVVRTTASFHDNGTDNEDALRVEAFLNTKKLKEKTA